MSKIKQEVIFEIEMWVNHFQQWEFIKCDSFEKAERCVQGFIGFDTGKTLGTLIIADQGMYRINEIKAEVK